MLRDIRADVDGVALRNMKEAVQFPYLSGIFMKAAPNRCLSVLFRIFHTNLPEALPHYVRIAIVKAMFVVSRSVRTLVYYDAGFTLPKTFQFRLLLCCNAFLLLLTSGLSRI